MSNRYKNNARILIPTRALPPGSFRTTLADGTRVWMINGMNFESKKAYYQYVLDKRLAEKAKQGPSGSDGAANMESTVQPLDAVQSLVDDK